MNKYRVLSKTRSGMENPQTLWKETQIKQIISNHPVIEKTTAASKFNENVNVTTKKKYIQYLYIHTVYIYIWYIWYMV